MRKLLIILLLAPQILLAQSDSEDTSQTLKNPWYKNINIRGYLQVRYNRLLETNPNLQNEQGDKSIGGTGGLFIRRARVIFSGQLNNNVYFYIQPDFASSISSDDLNFGQIRDAYVDLSVGKERQYRVRLGQSKIPYGFENMQSSSNRLPMDRSDGINSAFVNERDLGAFFYYAPGKTRKLFADLVNKGLKGSGDYGVLGLGFFNGQGANKPDKNNNMHVVGRLSYPFEWNGQIIEPGIQAYTGLYTLIDKQLSQGTKLTPDRTYRDERVAASFILYPKPFGIQAEYNIGRGPQYDATLDSIVSKNLDGGYILFSYRQAIKDHIFIPFMRAHYYDGGKKFELDARSHRVNEYEFGVEWQPMKYFELVAMYTISQRTTSDMKLENNRQRGNMLRLQVQLNF